MQNHEITNAKQADSIVSIVLDHMTVMVIETRGGRWTALAAMHGDPLPATNVHSWSSRDTAAEIAAGIVGFQTTGLVT